MASSGLSTGGDGLWTLGLPALDESIPVEDLVLELFTEMHAPVFRHLMWLHLRPDQAEDVVQEVFLRLYQHLSRANFPRYNLRGWVWRVAHNLGLNLRIAAKRKENCMGLDEVSEWLADPRPNPEQALQRRQCEQRIATGIQQLNERDRQCMHLRAQGLGYRQIASVMGVGRSTVADTLDRVTTILRSCSHS